MAAGKLISCEVRNGLLGIADRIVLLDLRTYHLAVYCGERLHNAVVALVLDAAAVCHYKRTALYYITVDILGRSLVVNIHCRRNYCLVL